MEWLNRLNRIAAKIKQQTPPHEQYIHNAGCLTFLKGALFTFYHFAAGTTIGLALINAYYKIIK
ncbi:MAG: hypothetical protein QXR48_04750 [Candidatus Woesearchaeota archaeon]